MRIFTDRSDRFRSVCRALRGNSSRRRCPRGCRSLRRDRRFAFSDVRSFHRRAHGEEIVFTNQDDRQFVERDQIQRFVEGTLIDRAVAEEAKCDAIFLAIFRSERPFRGKRNVRAHNRVPAVHVIFLVEKMHRAAEPLGTAGCFAKKFGHARIRARAAGKRVAVIAISQ